jgi:thymidine phosphorylase
MDAPLGEAIGNALEVIEAIETLKGRGPDDFRNLCLVLASHLLVMAAFEADLEAARQRAEEALSGGAALDKFTQLVERQGGDATVIDDYGRFPQAARNEPLRSPESGFVARIKADEIGRASMLLGAGRTRVDAPIDHGAGILLRRKPGDRVEQGDVLADLAVGAAAQPDAATRLALAAFVISPDPPPPLPVVLGVVL